MAVAVARSFTWDGVGIGIGAGAETAKGAGTATGGELGTNAGRTGGTDCGGGGGGGGKDEFMSKWNQSFEGRRAVPRSDAAAEELGRQGLAEFVLGSGP